MAMKLQDEKLFRQHCYIDGEWVDAIGRETIPVTNPATGETLGTVPKMGAEETRRAIEAADRALPAWRAKTAKERAQILRNWFDLMMANQDDLATADDRRAGQAAGRGEGRDRLCRLVHRMVRRGRQAHLRRHDPVARRRQAHRRDQGADRRLRRDHAVEFPGRDDHPQGRAGAGRRLHDGAEAGDRRRRSRRWRCANWPSAPACRRASSPASPAAPRRSAAR